MKLKILYVSPQFIIELCKWGAKDVEVIDNVLPADTKYIRAFTDDTTGWGRIGIVIQSDSFPKLQDGQEIPVIHPLFNKRS